MTDHAGRPYTLISSDAHAGADLLDYRPYLEREYHEEFDVWAANFQEDAWSKLDDEAAHTEDQRADPNLTVGVSSFASPYNWDSDKRVEHMDAEGIAGEVIFPNTVPPFYPRGIISAPAPATPEEYRLRRAGIKAHNRWLVDFCSRAPGRRAGLAQVFLYDIDDAIAEVRWAKEAGLAGALVPADHTLKLVDLYERRLDPFWAACCDADLPVTRHALAVGPPETPERGPATDAISMHETVPFFRRGLAHLLLGGVFERYPELRFAFTEGPVGWVPDELELLDYGYRRALTAGTIQHRVSRRAAESLSRPPSEPYRSNVWLGVSLLVRTEVEARYSIGVDRMMWGSDYPHHEGSWPRTRLVLRWNFSDVPEDEVRAMTSLNVAKVYGFDLGFLQTIADRIGPTPYEIAQPVAAHELPKTTMNRSLEQALETLGAAG